MCRAILCCKDFCYITIGGQHQTDDERKCTTCFHPDYYRGQAHSHLPAYNFMITSFPRDKGNPIFIVATINRTESVSLHRSLPSFIGHIRCVNLIQLPFDMYLDSGVLYYDARP